MLFPSPHEGVIGFKPTPEQPELPVFSVSLHCSSARCTSEILSLSVSTAPAVTSEIILAQQGAWHLPPSSIYSGSQVDFLLQSANVGVDALHDLHFFFNAFLPLCEQASFSFQLGPCCRKYYRYNLWFDSEGTSKLAICIGLPVANHSGYDRNPRPRLAQCRSVNTFTDLH